MFQQHPTQKGLGDLLWRVCGRKHWVRWLPFFGRKQQSDRSPPFGDQASPAGGVPTQVAVTAPTGSTNCLQWRAGSSGSFLLFLSPGIHPSKQYFWNASALRSFETDHLPEQQLQEKFSVPSGKRERKLFLSKERMISLPSCVVSGENTSGAAWGMFWVSNSPTLKTRSKMFGH